MTTFADSVQPIMNQYARRRISAFAKRHGVSNDDVEVVNDIPIEQLEKDFKRNNNIKTRLYKNMNEEQQKAWELYYNDHKKLSLAVKITDPVQVQIKVNNMPPQSQPLPQPLPQSITTLINETEDEHELKPVKPKRSTHKKQALNNDVSDNNDDIMKQQPQQTTMINELKPVKPKSKRSTRKNNNNSSN